jgi:hypothetical protein
LADSWANCINTSRTCVLWFFGFTPEIIQLDEIYKNYIFWLYLIGYFTSFVGIYIIRFVSMSLKALTAPEEEVEEE